MPAVPYFFASCLRRAKKSGALWWQQRAGSTQTRLDLEHDPEKCAAVFQKDHAQSNT
jgi:hypothetical protein